MTRQPETFRSVILASERPGGSPLSQVFDIPASVMVPVAGRPALERVMQTIDDSQRATGGIICGPAAEVIESCDALQNLLQKPGFKWLSPADGPAASAVSSLQELDDYPMLLTAGDHALLTAEIVDDFCKQVSEKGRRSGADFVIGLVPFTLVQAAWPESKRTVLKFSNGRYCGSNLFAILNPNGLKALSFWRQAEADRKTPWRIARRFSLITMIRYLLGNLTLESALQALSSTSGCKVGYVSLDYARAAVDVDSIEDQRLAEQILSAESANPDISPRRMRK